jgi:hypothetical protein
MFIPPDVKHPKTLDNYGLDPTEPMADTPVSFDISIASYGSFFQFLGLGAGGAPVHKWMFGTINKIAYDYKVFKGTAPDVFGDFVAFPFKSYFLWYSSFGDTVVDFSVDNTAPVKVTEGEKQYVRLLTATGFRVKNLDAGSNTEYQLVIFR